MATLLESLQSLITNPDFLKTILQTGSQVGGAIAGNNAQNQATNQALGVLTDQGNRNTQLAVDLINQTRAEEAPFQEGALQRLKFSERFLPRIEANLSGVDIPGSPQPGESEIFKRALEKSNDRLQRRFSVTGSPSSGPGQIAIGENTAGLTAFDIDRQQGIKDNFTNNLFRAAGFSGQPVQSQAPGLVPAAQSNTGANQADLLTAQGAATGGLFADIGFAGSQIPNIFNINQGLSSGAINIADLFKTP